MNKLIMEDYNCRFCNRILSENHFGFLACEQCDHNFCYNDIYKDLNSKSKSSNGTFNCIDCKITFNSLYMGIHPRCYLCIIKRNNKLRELNCIYCNRIFNTRYFGKKPICNSCKN